MATSQQSRPSVMSVHAAIELHGRSAMRHAVEKGRWQRPHPGVVVKHSGELTVDERRLAALTWAGPRAVLSHATAAEMAGLIGFETPTIHVTVPTGYHHRSTAGVAVHMSRFLERDTHPTHQPRRTRTERSLIDMASSAPTPDRARCILAAAVQQRLTTAGRLQHVLGQFPSLPRHALIATSLDDIAGGSHSLPELEFIAAIRAAGLPEPDRQRLWTHAGTRSG